jgi:hypothetical protein
MKRAEQMRINGIDRNRLRDLARRVAEIAAMPIMAERRDLWRRHNRMEIVLLDTHTCEFHSERFDEWSRIAHESVTE